MAPRIPRLLPLAALSAAALPAQSTETLLHEHFGVAAGDEVGRALAVIGDLDGDGLADYAVGAPRADPFGRTNAGTVELCSGADGSRIRLHYGSADHDWLGSAIAAPGDLDGDGVADVVASAANAAGHAGEVLAWSGASGALLWSVSGAAPLDRFGDALCAVDDLDGDGVRELLASATGADSFGLQNTGLVQLLSGASGVELLRFEGDGDGDKLGFAVAAAGDLNGDGFEDLALGAPFADRGLPNTGLVRLHSGADGSLLRSIDGPSEEARFGHSLSAPGDVDGDGLPELLCGAPNSGLEPGVAWLLPGSGGAPLLSFREGIANGFGQRVASAGDQDGDGVAELLVGVPYHDEVAAVHASAGRAVLYSGADGRLLWDFVGGGAGDTLGDALAAGDLTGDGKPELLLGSPFADGAGGSHSGSAAVWAYHHDPVVTLSANSLSLGAGGSVQIELQFPLADAGARYALVMSQTGTGPVLLKGHYLPLTPDPMFWKCRDGQYNPAFQAPAGTLDAAAAATAGLTVPAASASQLAGTSLWISALSHGNGQGIRHVAAAHRLDFLP